jgi:TusA-related sulfurtransferase
VKENEVLLMDPGKSVEIVEFDLRGEACASTLLKSLSQMHRMKDELRRGAAVLVILTDGRDSADTVSEAALSMGYGVTVAKEDMHYRLRIETEC